VRYARWLTGVGIDVHLLCPACLERQRLGVETPVAPICETCHETLTLEYGDLLGTYGAPGFPEDREDFDATVVERLLPTHAPVLDLADLRDETAWLLLGEDGSISRLDPDAGVAEELLVVSLPAEPDAGTGDDERHGPRPRPRLHASPSGAHVAVVNDHGRRGIVVDMATGEVTMTLDGGDHHPWTVPFSVLFFEHEGTELLVHRTAGNRLDVSDPRTGELLTSRGPTSYQHGGARPDHFLDYFHGRLIGSPDGRRVVDDGWVWHPVGVLVAWDLLPWLERNPWESEDGPSLGALCQRDYYWGHGVCWIDDHRVAVEGLGDDDLEIVPGARIFDLDQTIDQPGQRSFVETSSFAGPSGALFSDGVRFFSSDESGTSIWRISDGARVGAIEGFRPTHQHVAARELVEIRGPSMLRWCY
jgi:hypothetical protein